MPSHVIVVDDFFAGAGELRRAYDERLGDPYGGSRERFVWDYFHVPDQYTYIRTFAQEFFPSELYSRFIEHLKNWGRENLGCTRIVPPWLSYYISGCRQELHADVPHGPWAYVFSLTDWDGRGFTGGETFLLSPQTLDFWRAYDPTRHQVGEFAELIPSPFNRLTVFDPRIPHGVRQVEGTQNPLDSRVAIHGWFHEPAVVVSDAVEQAGRALAFQATLGLLQRMLQGVDDVTGHVTARVDVQPDGGVSEVKIVTSSAVATTPEGSPESVEQMIRDSLAETTFPPMPEDAWAVVPVSLPVGNPSH